MLYSSSQWLALTWDVVDGDGKNEEKDAPPTASCLPNSFLLFISCFLSFWAAQMRSFPPLVNIPILYFICTGEKKNKDSYDNTVQHLHTDKQDIRLNRLVIVKGDKNDY